MKKENWKNILTFLAIAITMVIFFFQNCAEVQYIKPDQQVSTSLGDENKVRTVYLRPTTQSDYPTGEVKVLLVVDDSASMTRGHEKLKDSIYSLLQPLKDFPVVLKIISTTNLGQYAGLENKGWSSVVRTIAPTTVVTEDWRKALGIQPQEVLSYGWDIFYSLNQVDLYSIPAHDAQLDTKINQIKDRILQISQSGDGSDQERGLCNALLALHDRGPYRIFQPGDKAAIVFITDENDSSAWQPKDGLIRSKCYNRYTYGGFGDPQKEAIVHHTYSMNLWTARFTLEYDQNNDGRLEHKTGADSGGIRLYLSDQAVVAGLSPTGITECTPELWSRANKHAQFLYPPPFNENVKVTGCTVKAAWTAQYDFGTDENVNRCYQPFEYKGIQYNDMNDFYSRYYNYLLVSGSCTRSVSKRMFERPFTNFYIDQATDPEILNAAKVMPAQQQQSIINAIFNRASELFGKDGFIISSIINKNSDCVGANQSIGSAYLNMATGTPFASQVKHFSICDNSFATALNGIGYQLSTMVNNELPLPKLETNEFIQRATLVKGSVRTSLVAGQDYEIIQTVDGSNLKVMKVKNIKFSEGDFIEIIIEKN